jgi:hypothetical protein
VEGNQTVSSFSNLLIMLVTIAGFDPAIRRFESCHPSHKRKSPPTGGLSRLWRGGRITAAVLDLAGGVISRAASWLIALCCCSFQRTVAGPEGVRPVLGPNNPATPANPSQLIPRYILN